MEDRPRSGLQKVGEICDSMETKAPSGFDAVVSSRKQWIDVLMGLRSPAEHVAGVIY